LNKNFKLKYKTNNLFYFKKENTQNKFIKLNFFINYLFKFYVSKNLSINNEYNIILKYYFYFYNFIIKIFVKLLYNLKLIILNKYNLDQAMKKFIWVKIFLVFLYYRKILINNIYSKLINKNNKQSYKLRKLIKNIYFKRNVIKNSLITTKFNFFIKKLPQWRKKVVNEKLNKFLKTLRMRISLISKITYYKNGNYFIFLRVNKLKQIHRRLINKMNKMKNFKNLGILKKPKLIGFIKNNKLKPKRVFNFIGLKFKVKLKKKKYVKNLYCR
jgi:hypothetical protein